MTAGLNAWASIIDKALGGDLDDGAGSPAYSAGPTVHVELTDLAGNVYVIELLDETEGGGLLVRTNRGRLRLRPEAMNAINIIAER